MDTVATWLAKIETIHPQAMALGLDRIAKVARKLNVLEFNCPVVMVGGTNGKGSCVKFLESIYTEAGYRVGAYTSPHLLNFNERIRIGNRDVSDELLMQAFQAIDQARQEVALTFFEFTTLAALWLFKSMPLDVILLEVGLGGRLDAVNIVTADIVIITSISFDHMDLLGDTREQIASEKAGIIKKGQEVIIGDPNPPNALFEQARMTESNVYCLAKDFTYRQTDQGWDFLSELRTITHLPKPQLSIPNASIALMTTLLLEKNLPINVDHIKTGMTKARLPGRFDFRDTPYPTVLDVAHNEASAELLAQNCLTIGGDYIAVVGMLADKDIISTLKPFLSMVSQWHFATLNVPRGATAGFLVSKLEKIANHECYTYDCVAQAYDEAGKQLSNLQRILVFGSFFTVAEVLQHIAHKTAGVSAPNKLVSN